MINKPLNPHLTNTTSTIANEFPSLGQDKPPADMLTNVDPNYTPKDSVPENTERMTGGTQAGMPKTGPNAELDVGEIQGGTFKVEPNRRSGESKDTLRARLLCLFQCTVDLSLSPCYLSPAIVPVTRNDLIYLLTSP